MKLCIPVEQNKGSESTVYGHFGSAPFFMIYDSETKEIKALQNKNEHHEHGMCNPLGALDSNPVDAVLVGGIGARAVMKLNAAGVKVYRSAGGNAEENIKRFHQKQLEEISVDNSCQHHDCH
jgi:predicted Fe-Mo cluster-binding NifX family protein